MSNRTLGVQFDSRTVEVGNQMGRKVWLSDTQWVFDDAVKYKAPSDVLDYVVDLSNAGANDGSATDAGWLQGDTIASVTWTVPTGIVKNSQSTTTTKATIWLSSGAAGTDYLITGSFVTAAARTHAVSLLVKVRSS
jgi:hypothetical protein